MSYRPFQPPTTYSVSLQELPQYWLENRQDPVADIADCLSCFIINFKRLWQHAIKSHGYQQVLFFPSFDNLRRYFLCSDSEMLLALQQLETRHGIVFELVGIKSPVLIYLFYTSADQRAA